METKICTICKIEKEASLNFFFKQKKGRYGVKSQCKKCILDKKKKDRILKPKIIKEFKVCSRCKVEFPLNKDFFFTKTTKKGVVVNGYELKNNCVSFRSVCKKCNGKITLEKKQKKRAEELGVDLSFYLENKIELQKKALREAKTKFPMLQNIGIRKGCASYIRKKIREGYVFTNLEDYKKQVQENFKEASIKKRKEDYGDAEKATQKIRVELLLDSHIKTRLGFKKSDYVPKEIIESKRLIMQLKRELNKINK